MTQGTIITRRCVAVPQSSLCSSLRAMAAVDPPVRLIMVISLAAEAYATGWESFNGSSYYITAAHTSLTAVQTTNGSLR